MLWAFFCPLSIIFALALAINGLRLGAAGGVFRGIAPLARHDGHWNMMGGSDYRPAVPCPEALFTKPIRRDQRIPE